MEIKQKRRERIINWQIGIPVLLWILCVALGIIKNTIAAKRGIDIFELFDVFNSNTFSTFLSVILCKLYQYFTEDDEKKEIKSGLSQRMMPCTIIVTGIYVLAAAFDAAWNSGGMIIVYFVVNLIYVYCFFFKFTVHEI